MKRLLLGLLLLLIPVHVGAETVIINGVTVVLGSSIVNPTITGGTIDGTVIGGTTPAAGSFTTLVANTLDTGQGANELYDMDQNVLTTSGVTFGDAVLGVAATDPGNLTIHDGGILTMWDDGNDFSVTLQVTDGTTQLHLTGILDVSGNIYAGGNASPDSGDGATLGTVDREWSDLYLASSGVIYGENDQSNTLTSSATGWTANLNFTATGALAGATLNTGQGAYELYAMNQDVETTDSPTFVTAKLSGLTDTYIPYHVADATGLADSPLKRTSANTVTIYGQDPAFVFDGSTATDTDFWVGVTADEDGVDDDKLQIGDGTTPGTNPFVTIDTSGKVGIGTAAPQENLEVAGRILIKGRNSNLLKIWDTTYVGSLAFEGPDSNTNETAYCGIWGNADVQTDGIESGSVVFGTMNGGTSYVAHEVMRLNYNGNVGIGTTAPNTKLDQAQFSADAVGSYHTFSKSRHATAGSHTVVQDNDVIGGINFAPSDGTDFGTVSAQIKAEVDDAAPAASSIGGALVFSTAAGAAGDDLTERMRITKTGGVNIANGNLIMSTSGTGIDFSATSDAAGMTSELLDDYEEGYYTATLTCGTSGTITVDADIDQFAYTKIGRKVTVTGELKVGSVDAPLGSLRLNLPFSIGTLNENAENFSGSISYYTINALGTAGSMILITGSGASCAIREQTTTTSVDDVANHILANTYLTVGLTYFVD